MAVVVFQVSTTARCSINRFLNPILYFSTLNYYSKLPPNIQYTLIMIYLIKSVLFSIFSFLLCAFLLLLLFLLREIVLKLLQYEASTNVADNKGYFPIHLAAWKGDEEIVKILIHHGPSHSRVNEQVHLSNVCSCYTFSRVLRRQSHK